MPRKKLKGTLSIEQLLARRGQRVGDAVADPSKQPVVFGGKLAENATQSVAASILAGTPSEFTSIMNRLARDVERELGSPRSAWDDDPATRSAWADDGPAVYPGLTSRRRVVLELGFRGLGIGTTIVDKTGELLAIEEPGTPRYDPVGGVVLARMPIGLAVRKLIDGGAKFDLVVADLTDERTVQAVGHFKPEPVLRPAGSRRLILSDAPAVVTPPTVSLRSAVLSCVEELLSARFGEALLRLPDGMVSRQDFDRLRGLRPSLWFADVRPGTATHLYFSRLTTPRTDPQYLKRMPERDDRIDSFGRLRIPATTYTPGQPHAFRELLLSPCPPTKTHANASPSTKGRSLA